MATYEMDRVQALLSKWNDEATSLMNTPGYENHSRACLTKAHIREVMDALSIPRPSNA